MPQVTEEEMPSKGVTKESSKFKSSSFKPATEPEDGDGVRAAEPSDIGGAATDDIDGEPVDGDDLDGMPLDEDVHTEPLDGEPLDGEPLDGEPLDYDPLDGEPLDGEPFGTDTLETELAAPHDNDERQGEESDVSMEMDEDSD
jgi:U2-associated protein SR140